MKKKIYQLIFHGIMGWRIDGQIDAQVKKCVIIVVPHTSWHDFYIGVFARGILQQRMNFVAKKELFSFPFGLYFKWMGGQPLNRKKNEGKVEAIARIFREQDEFRLAIAPEGTRGKVDEWKTGFYYIAKEANVPVVPVAFDYKKKVVTIHSPYMPTESMEADFSFLYDLYKEVEGKVAKNSFNE